MYKVLFIFSLLIAASAHAEPSRLYLAQLNAFNAAAKGPQIFSMSDFRETSYNKCVRIEKNTAVNARPVVLNTVVYYPNPTALFDNKLEVPAIYETYMRDQYQNNTDVKKTYTHTASLKIENTDLTLISGWNGNNNIRHIFRKDTQSGDLYIKVSRILFSGLTEVEEALVHCRKNDK